MASRGKGAQVKGKNFERKVAKLFTDAFECLFKRGLGQSRGGGQEIPDGHSEEIDVFHIEAKHHKRVNIKAAILQAIADVENSKSGRIPIAVTHEDRQDIYVTLRLEDFFTIAKDFMSNADNSRMEDLLGKLSN